MRCANTEALDKFMDGETKFELITDKFTSEVIEWVEEIKSFASNYEDYDLTELLKDIVKDELRC